MQLCTDATETDILKLELMSHIGSLDSSNLRKRFYILEYFRYEISNMVLSRGLHY